MTGGRGAEAGGKVGVGLRVVRRWVFQRVPRSMGPPRRFRRVLRSDAALVGRLRRATAGFTFTFSALDGLGLRCHWPARPNTACLTSSSCSSARAFASRFFQTLPHRSALSLIYSFTSLWL